MVRQQCPKSLSKYGFCGILALIYAAKLPMPSSIEKLEDLFKQIKGILSMGKGKWKSANPKNKGAITLPQTMKLLQHYNACQFKLTCLETSASPTLKQWIHSAEVRSSYIVHLGRHALFVEIGAVKSKWRVYDQGGVYTKQNASFLEKKGGYGKKKIKAVIKIIYGK